MNGNQIGIKIADGTFYPVLSENDPRKKRFVVTTVKDNQENVQIDLYRSSEKTLQNADFIGSLLIENIVPAPKGEPEIEITLGTDVEGNLTAHAREPTSGSDQTFEASLMHLQPTVEPGVESDQIMGVDIPQEEELTGTSYPLEMEDRRKTHLKKKRNPLLRIVFIIVGLIIIVGITYLLYRAFNNSSRAVTAPEVGQAVEQTEPQNSAKSTDAQPPERRPTDRPPGESKEEAPQEPRATKLAAQPKTGQPAQTANDGDWHMIRWGDTLWDISAEYYLNPFMYFKIANHPRNGIQNPDYILAGFKLYIPKG